MWFIAFYSRRPFTACACLSIRQSLIKYNKRQTGIAANAYIFFFFFFRSNDVWNGAEYCPKRNEKKNAKLKKVWREMNLIWFLLNLLSLLIVADSAGQCQRLDRILPYSCNWFFCAGCYQMWFISGIRVKNTIYFIGIIISNRFRHQIWVNPFECILHRWNQIFSKKNPFCCALPTVCVPFMIRKLCLHR